MTKGEQLMFKIKIGVVLAAVVAVFAVSAAPSMAFTKFVSKPGSGQIKGKSTSTNQIFKTEDGEVKCGTAEAGGKVIAEKSPMQELEFKYSKCKIIELPVTITQPKYTFYANGQVKLNNEVKITAAGCQLKVPGPQKFGEGEVAYTTNGNNLVGTAHVKGIKYIGAGNSCTHSGENGEYEGTEELEGDNPPTTLGIE
jgi:hypothetical protein